MQTPDVLDKILSATPQQIAAAKEFPAQAPPKRQAPWRAAACAVAAVFVAVAGVLYSVRSPEVESIVSLDVNPSFELTVDGRDKVIDCFAVNEDAQAVLEGVSLKNMDLDAATETIISSTREHGYLTAEGTPNTILVSVANADVQKADALKEKVSSSVDAALKSNNTSARVIQQSDVLTPEVQKFAKDNGISVGKADLVCRLSQKDEALDPTSLSQMSIGEISSIIEEKQIDVSDVLTEYVSTPESSGPESSEEPSSSKTPSSSETSSSSEPSSSSQMSGDSGNPSSGSESSQTSGANSEIMTGYCEYCGRPNAECKGTCSHKYGKLYCAVCGNRLLLCTCNEHGGDSSGGELTGYCEYCGKLMSECGGNCDHSIGKQYCADCGKLYSLCQCRDSGAEGGDPYFGPHNPGRYCEYCGELNSRCKGTCETTGGKQYCRNCGELKGFCECSEDDENSEVEFGDFPPVDDANG